MPPEFRPNAKSLAEGQATVDDRIDRLALPEAPIDGSWTVMVDRDGVINRRIVGGYVRSIDEFDVLPGAVSALVSLSQAVGRVVLVTNQAGVGKRLMTVADLDSIHAFLIESVARHGGRIEAVFYCPHVLEDNCTCRKPRTGMAKQALERFPEMSLERTVVIGDSRSDIEFAWRLGVPSIKIDNSSTLIGIPHAAAVALDLKHAAWIMTRTNGADTY